MLRKRTNIKLNGKLLKFAISMIALSIPITSFGGFSFLSADVKPFWIFIILLLIPYTLIFTFNRLVKISMFFLIVFILYSLTYGFVLNFLNDDVAYKNMSILDMYLRGIIPLIFGAIFYLTLRFLTQDAQSFRRFLKCAVYSVSASSVFACVQFITSHYIPNSTLILVVNFISKLLVDTSYDWMVRPYGFTLEASWLSSQVAIIVLPIVMFTILNNGKLFQINIFNNNIRLDWIIIAVNVLAIGITGSRSGIIYIVLIVLSGILTSFMTSLRRSYRGMLIMVALMVFGAPSVYLGFKNEYFTQTVKNITTLVRTGERDVYEISKSVYIGPRVSAWQAGIRTFIEQPLMGVGLGNSPRYFSKYVPSWAYNEPEVRRWLSDSADERANTKNFLIKLLAEFGIIGTCIYAAFFFSHFIFTDRRIVSLHVMLLTALFFDFFSVDSFMLPWVWIGLLIALRYKQALEENAS